MSLATPILAPQRFRLDVEYDGADVVEILVDLGARLGTDPARLARVGEIVGGVVVPALQRALLEREERVRLSEGKARALFGGHLDTLMSAVNGVGDDPGESIAALLGLLRALVDGLTLEGVQSFLEDALDLVEQDLGLDQNVVRDLVVDLLEDIVTALEAPLGDGEDGAEALALFELGRSIASLRVLLLDELTLPGLDRRLLRVVLPKVWAALDIDRVLEPLREIVRFGDEVVTPLAKVASCMAETAATVSGGVSVGAAAANGAGGEREKVAFYATWVIGERVTWQPPEGDREAALRALPALEGFTWKHASANAMEHVAFHSTWAVGAIDAIVHLASLEKGDYASNLVNALVSDAILDIVLPTAFKEDAPTWVYVLIKTWLTALAGFEGNDGRELFGDDGLYTWTNMFGDIGEMYLYRRWLWLGREFLLSLLTLINNDPEAAASWHQSALHEAEHADDPDAARERIARAMDRRNCNQFQGLCYGVGELGSLILPGILSATDRANYGFIGGGPTGDMFGKAFGGMAITLSFSYLSLPLARWAAGEWPTDGWAMGKLAFKERFLGRVTFREGGWQGFLSVFRLPLSLFWYLIDHILYLYLFTNNNTDDGTYAYDRTATERTFVGYPDDGDATYALPWPDDVDHQCVQNNMGIWSHFPQSNAAQIYAYDFSHDQGNSVNCSRDGVIVQSRDTIGDNVANQGWNFVQVLHVTAFEPATAGGAPTIPAPWDAFPDLVFPGFAPGPGVNYADDGSEINPAAKAANDITVFPPYNAAFAPWFDGSNVPFWKSAGFRAGTLFAFLDPRQDRACAGRVHPTGTTFTDTGTPVPTDRVYAPDAPSPPASTTPNFPLGVTFMPPFNAGGPFTPLLYTCAEYGHARNSFIPAVYPGLAAGANLSGIFVRRGQRVMESGDTGVSAYNHLHMHVIGFGQTGAAAPGDDITTIQNTDLTLPFKYREEGRLKAMNYYTSDNVETTPRAGNDP